MQDEYDMHGWYRLKELLKLQSVETFIAQCLG
jgi:hypothetical protein